MCDSIQISFPSSAPRAEVDTIQNMLKNLNEIQDAGSIASRSVDPASIMIWIQVVSGMLGLVATGMPVIEKIIKMIRSKGISGAIIKLPNGTELPVDNASGSDIAKLLTALGNPLKQD